MTLIILMQRSKQEGLGAAFGSGMTESVFGAHTSTVLSKMTVWCAILFFLLTLALSSIYARRSGMGSAVQQMLTQPQSVPTVPSKAVPAPVSVSTNKK